MGTEIVSVAPEVERELRDHTHVDRLDMMLNGTILAVARDDVAGLRIAVRTLELAVLLPDTVMDWETVTRAVEAVETAAARLYLRARVELRRCESESDRAAVNAYLRSSDPEATLSVDDEPSDCGRVGRPGACGCCDTCCNEGDAQHDARAQR